MTMRVNKMFRYWILITVLFNNINLSDERNIMKAARDLSTKRRFCGPDLADTLSHVCKQYNTPLKDGVDIRTKRAIVEECCTNTCSPYYLIKNYCKSSVFTAEESESSDVSEGRSKMNAIPVEGRTMVGERATQAPTIQYATQVRKSRKTFARRPAMKGRLGWRRCTCRKRRGKEKHDLSRNAIRKEIVNRPPAILGLVESTRPPIIWPSAHKPIPPADSTIRNSQWYS